MATLYWKATASGNATVAANWNTAADGSGTDQAPATSDTLIIQQGGDCVLNLALNPIAALQVLATYTGRLRVTGSSKIGNTTINANGVTFESTSTTTLDTTFTVAEGITVTVTSPANLFTYAGCNVQILGSIVGTGKFTFYTYNTNNTIKLANIGCSNISLENLGISPASYTLSLFDSYEVPGVITVKSLHGTYLLNLDLKGKALKCANLVHSARGVIKSTVAGATLEFTDYTAAAAAQLIETNITVMRANGSVDISAATYTMATARWEFLGTTKTLKLGVGHALYDVSIPGSLQLLAQLTVSNEMRVPGSLDPNGQTITYNHATAQNIYGLPNATVVVSCPKAVFYNTKLLAASVTLSGGGKAIAYLDYIALAWVKGDFNYSALPKKFISGTRAQVAAGTLTFDVRAQMRRLTVDANTTAVQSAGVMMSIAEGVAGTGTFTKNSPKLLVTGIEAGFKNVAKNAQRNKHKVRGL